MCEQLELDTNFEPISVAAEAVVSRLQKARWRAEHGGRLDLIIERRNQVVRGVAGSSRFPSHHPGSLPACDLVDGWLPDALAPHRLTAGISAPRSCTRDR